MAEDFAAGPGWVEVGVVEAAVDSVAGAETTAAVVDLAGLAEGVLVAVGLVGIGRNSCQWAVVRDPSGISVRS